MKEQENHSRERESEAVEKMFSSSERIYEIGSRDDIKVPFRRVIQENTKAEAGEHENPPIFVYDTSGPFGDKKLGTHFRNRVDVRKGIQSTRGTWIKEREDTKALSKPSSEFGRKKIVIFGLILFSTGSLICFYANQINILILGRVIQGLGAISSVGIATLSENTSEENRASAFTIMGIAVGGSFFIGFLAGPYFASLYSFKSLFILLLAFGIIATFIN